MKMNKVNYSLLHVSNLFLKYTITHIIDKTFKFFEFLFIVKTIDANLSSLISRYKTFVVQTPTRKCVDSVGSKSD